MSTLKPFPDSERINLLVDLLDSILLSRVNSISRLSNSLLTFVRPSVTDIGQYQILRQKYFPARLILFALSKIPPLLILSVRSLIASFRPLSLPSSTSNCLLISYLLNSQTICNEDDFYFNRIQSMLASSGNSACLLYINSIPGRSSLRRIRKADNKYVLPMIPPFHIFLKALLCSLSDSFCLGQESIIESSPFRARALLLSAINSISSSSILNTARSLFISSTVAKCQPRFLFLLYEGHPWERAAIASSRLANPSTFILAYQHATLFPFQHSIQRPLSATSEPDVILTSGSTSHKILSQRYSSSVISPSLCLIGSPRYIPPQIQYKPSNCTQRILLLPDGSPLECHHYLRLALDLTQLLPSTLIAIRFHPLVDVAQIYAQLNSDKSALPSNLLVSSLTFQSDIASSSHVIYTGSSSIAAAAVSGLWCFRFDYSIDCPLRDPFALTSYDPPSFTTAHQFCKLFKPNLERLNVYHRQLAAAQTLYSPFSPERILSLIADR